jgi:polyhydroxyalkanoate synthesis regulator phasin
MSDQPLTLAVLARFHQEILMPEVRQVVREEVAKEVGALRDEMHAGFDAIAQRFDRLERVEHKLDRFALKSDVLALKARVEALERRLSESDG